MLSIRSVRWLSFALGVLLVACAAPEPREDLGVTRLADGEDDAIVSWHSIPGNMTCGEQRQVTVEMINYGSSTWEPGNYFLSAVDGPGPFDAPAEVELTSPVAFGEPYAFSFPLRAPSYPAEAYSKWRMWGPGPFGDIAGEEPQEIVHVTCAAAEDRARVAGADFPDTVGCGETFGASVTLQNVGQSTWTTAQQYRLEASPDNPFEGPAQVSVGGSIPAQASHTFHLTLTAPPGPGDYPNHWQMTSNAGGPFDDAFDRSIHVSCDNPPDDRATITHDIPPSVQCGGHFSFQVMVTNTGNTTWQSYPDGSHGYYLGLTDDSVPLGDPRYSFPSPLGRGQSHTFTIVMHGPPAADSYYVAFQMFNADRHEWFGPRAEQTIESTCNNENARVDDSSLATLVGCGQPYPVRVVMKNTGLWTWRGDQEYRLVNTSNLPFSPWTPHIPLPPNVSVAPGATYEFQALLHANYAPNTYFNAWQMASWTGAPFGEAAIQYVEVRCDEDMADNTDAVFPPTLQCGQVFQASVAYKNIGSHVWHPSYGYKLGAVGGTDPFAQTQIPIQGNPVVFPGDPPKTFKFNMIGPYSPPGWYHTDWKMFHNDAPFGEIAEADVRVECSPLDSHLVGASSPWVQNCDPEVELAITVRNTGFKTWGARPGFEPDEFSFDQAGKISPFALVESVSLPRDVKVRPGQTYTFPVRFRKADSAAPRAVSWWRMRIERPGGRDRIDSIGPELFGQTMRVPVPTMPRYCH